MYYSYVEIEYVATSFSPTRTDLALKLLTLDRVPVGSLHFVQFDSADLPCNKILRSGFLKGPLPFGMRLKVNPKGRHIFDRL